MIRQPEYCMGTMEKPPYSLIFSVEGHLTSVTLLNVPDQSPLSMRAKGGSK
jgi:hypothetical protein